MAKIFTALVLENICFDIIIIFFSHLFEERNLKQPSGKLTED